MIIFSHPTGNANVRAALNGLLQAKLLYEFDTSIASFPGSFLNKLARFGPLAEIERRSFDPAIKRITRSYPWFEIGRLISLKVGFKNFTKHEAGMFCIDSVYKQHDVFVSNRIKHLKDKINGVYAYEDGSTASFKQAKSMGIHCFYDLPIGYWRASQTILEEERKRWPEWASTLVGVKNSDKKLAGKDEELQLADSIFVASSFTAKTLSTYPQRLSNVKVIPYGFPPVSSERNYNSSSAKPLKILFVGGLSQRKGIADLFEVVKNLKDQVQLTVVGHKPSVSCAALDAALAKCTWIPSKPHNEILQLMREHDVFVFPSVFEGFGLVITEAMSQGTPVITTYNTAGADLIVSGKNGWLVDAASTKQLQEAIEKLISNPGLVAEAGLAAMQTAAKRPWHLYGKELSDNIKLIN